MQAGVLQGQYGGGAGAMLAEGSRAHRFMQPLPDTVAVARRAVERSGGKGRSYVSPYSQMAIRRVGSEASRGPGGD